LLLTASAVAICRWPPLASWLEWQRGSSQAWRILTCHLVHFSTNHLLWDLLPFFLLAFLCERIHARRFVLTLFTSAIVIPFMVEWFDPSITTYRGLSGLCSAMFGLLVANGFFEELRSGRRVGAIVCLACTAAFGLKLWIELAYGVTVFADNLSGYAPVPIAHAAGFGVGVLIRAVGAIAIPADRMPRHDDDCSFSPHP
jgi:rhomboid family GlyGly-CTERM serine protease